MTRSLALLQVLAARAGRLEKVGGSKAGEFVPEPSPRERTGERRERVTCGKEWAGWWRGRRERVMSGHAQGCRCRLIWHTLYARPLYLTPLIQPTSLRAYLFLGCLASLGDHRTKETGGSGGRAWASQQAAGSQPRWGEARDGVSEQKCCPLRSKLGGLYCFFWAGKVVAMYVNTQR